MSEDFLSIVQRIDSNIVENRQDTNGQKIRFREIHTAMGRRTDPIDRRRTYQLWSRRIYIYAISGIAADKIGHITGLGVGRGSAIVVQIAGICLTLVAVICSMSASLRMLEKPGGE